MKTSLTVWACLTTFLWAGPKPKTSTDILIFTNVNVANLRDGTIAQDMTVVIKKGQISGVAKVGLVEHGHGIQIVNACPSSAISCFQKVALQDAVAICT